MKELPGAEFRSQESEVRREIQTTEGTEGMHTERHGEMLVTF